MTHPRIQWTEIGGCCPSQGYGTIEVDGTRYDVYLRSRHGSWTLAIGTASADPDYRGYVDRGVWEWSGDDGTAWGLAEPSVRELCDLLTSEPVETWPRPPTDETRPRALTVSRWVVLPSPIVGAEDD